MKLTNIKNTKTQQGKAYKIVIGDFKIDKSIEINIDKKINSGKTVEYKSKNKDIREVTGDNSKIIVYLKSTKKKYKKAKKLTLSCFFI